MKEKKIGVSKVVIQLGDKEVTLTVEQVKELRDALNALLGNERVIERWYPRWEFVPCSGTITYGSTTVSNTSNGAYTITLNGDGNDLLPV